MTGAELRKERERLGYQSRAAAAIALGLNRASLVGQMSDNTEGEA
jgi:hypothetical protein